MFTLYIDDLPSVTETCKVILYADDNAIRIVTNEKHKLKTPLYGLNYMAIAKTWLDENKLTLNVKKCIGNNKPLNKAGYLDVKLYMDSIEQVGEFKYFEVWLDRKEQEGWCWVSQVELVREKCTIN